MTNNNWELYSCTDAAVTERVWYELQREDHRDELWPWYELNQRMLPVVLFMMTHGLAVDVPRLKAEGDRVRADIARLQDELNTTVGFPLNVNSNKQCTAYFYGILGQKPYVNRDGNPTCDDKALARLARKGVLAARLTQRIRALEKLRGTYLEIEYDDDERLRCSINITGTRTSRLSTNKTIFGTGGNMQNLPPSFRTFLVPDPGHFFIEMDKAKAEWVITAYVANEPNMIRAIESGVDVHAYTASRFYNVPVELVLAEDKLLGKTTDEELIQETRTGMPNLPNTGLPRSMSLRQAGKKTNHSCNYEIGYREFALQYELPEPEAKRLVESYSQVAYPGLPKWWDRVGNQLTLERRVFNCFGRPFYFYQANSPKLRKDAVSTIPQATSVEVLNRGMVAIYEDSEPYMQPIRLGMQVHDSILWQYPTSDLQSAAQAIFRTKGHIEPWLTYENRRFKIDTDLSIGMNWGDRGTDNPLGMYKVPLTTVDEVHKALQQAVNEWNNVREKTT